MKLFCFGFGYSANALADLLQREAEIVVTGTRRDAAPPHIAAYQGDAHSEDVARLLADATHVLISIPPMQDGCPVVRHFVDDIARTASIEWVGYLSTVGVYGDAAGGWVDEASALQPTSDRAKRRATAETQWLQLGTDTGKRAQVFRLPGIYGPGRSMLDSLRDGSAKRMIKPGQVFNRIHVDDIAGALRAAMSTSTTVRIFNITDDEPAPPQDVVTFAANLLGIDPPPETPYAAAALSPMAASFYAESKRVANARLKAVLGYRMKYPSYREGLRAILADEQKSRQ